MEKRRRAFVNYINRKAPPTAIPYGPKRRKWIRKDESSSDDQTRRPVRPRPDFFIRDPVARANWYDYIYRITDPVGHDEEDDEDDEQIDLDGEQDDQRDGAEQQQVIERQEEERDRTPPPPPSTSRRMSRADEQIIQEGKRLGGQTDSPKGSIKRTDHGKQVRRSSMIEVQIKPSDQMGYTKGLARNTYYNPEFKLWMKRESDGTETPVDPSKIFESASGGSSADEEQEAEEDKEKKKRKKGKTPKLPRFFKRKGGKKDKDSDGGGTTV